MRILLSSPRFLDRGLLLFWALYFTLVLASNTTDALQALGALPEGWAFVSGNYAFIAKVTAIYGTPAWINALLFAGVLIWQAGAVLLFWRAFRAVERDDLVRAAFAAGLGLWAAFILADEFFIAYEIADLEGSHLRLFIAQLLTLLALRR